jgi:hypothetical protein
MSFIGDIAKGLSEGLVSPLFSWLNKKEDKEIEKLKIDGKLDQTLVENYRQEIAIRAEISKDRRKTAGGRAMEYIFVYPLGAWWTGIIVYCIVKPWVPWWQPVLALPAGDFMTWAGVMIGAVFAVSKLDQWIRK